MCVPTAADFGCRSSSSSNSNSNSSDNGNSSDISNSSNNTNSSNNSNNTNSSNNSNNSNSSSTQSNGSNHSNRNNVNSNTINSNMQVASVMRRRTRSALRLVDGVAASLCCSTTFRLLLASSVKKDIHRLAILCVAVLLMTCFFSSLFLLVFAVAMILASPRTAAAAAVFPTIDLQLDGLSSLFASFSSCVSSSSFPPAFPLYTAATLFSLLSLLVFPLSLFRAAAIPSSSPRRRLGRSYPFLKTAPTLRFCLLLLLGVRSLPILLHLCPLPSPLLLLPSFFSPSLSHLPFPTSSDPSFAPPFSSLFLFSPSSFSSFLTLNRFSLGIPVAAAAAAPPAGQRVVSPVPPVAVAGRGDRQALPTFAALHEAASTPDFSTWLQKVRRELHAWPELMFQEHRTSALIQLVLEVVLHSPYSKHMRYCLLHLPPNMQALHIPFTKGWGSDTLEMHAAAAAQQRAMRSGTGIVAHVGTGAEPCIALRADMDALPISEKVDVPFRSKRENLMHACGHDVHVTLLLGAAALLKAIEPQLKGTVRLIFQPAEEGGAGGRCMREEGVLQLFPPARLVFGHHVDPSLPTGVIATRKDVLMAGVSNFTIEIEGKGGHAGYPNRAIDAAPAVAALLQGIYAIGSREVAFDQAHAGLITVTKIHGGAALNVIPPAYELGGTIRALSSEKLLYLETRLQQLAEHTAAAFRCSCRVRLSPRKYPPVLNDPPTTEFYQRVMAHASASGKVEESAIHMGGEDFAFYLQELPGTFAFIGVGSGAQVPGQPRSDYSLHSDMFAVDERVLTYGAAVEAYLALEALQHVQEAEKQKGEAAAALSAAHAAAAAAQAAAAAAARAVEEESAAAERRRESLSEKRRRAATAAAAEGRNKETEEEGSTDAAAATAVSSLFFSSTASAATASDDAAAAAISDDAAAGGVPANTTRRGEEEEETKRRLTEAAARDSRGGEEEKRLSKGKANAAAPAALKQNSFSHVDEL